MNFTREPIIETIVTPKEGFRLVIRNSNGNSQEEYSVNSVEVVSFGKSFFFRSLEKPKAFLVPVSDYEVVEARETRSVLKKPQIDKPIKIGGGRAPSKSKKKEAPPVAAVAAVEEEETQAEAPKKKGRTKSPRRRRSAKTEEATTSENKVPPPPPERKSQEGEEQAQPMRRALLPPPTSLISEQISRYKDYLATEGALLPEELDKTKNKVEELPKEATEDLSFLPNDEAVSQDPQMFEENSTQESHVVELEQEAPASPEVED